MTEEMKKMNEQEVENVAGGNYGGVDGGWRIVQGLQSGYLAMRTYPCYDYANEIRGCELYNGDSVQITGSWVQGSDGRTYVWVYSPKSGVSGYVNAAYIG